MPSETKRIVKKRNWAFVGYPESLPSDWKERLQKTGLPIAISPLHDSDIDEGAEGGPTPKKPHYHFILCFQGPTTENVVKKITDELGQPKPIAIESIKGQYRYHIHQDNPDKYQYEDRDRILLNGFNIRDFSDMSISEEDNLYERIEMFIEEMDIIEYRQLLMQLREQGESDLSSFARRHTMHINAYITSRRYETGRARTQEVEKG